MTTPQQLESMFWKALESDKTMMLGLVGTDDGHVRPMAAQLDGEKRSIWFFARKDNKLVQNLNKGSRAIATFASKGHEVFACVHGNVRLETDPAVVERLWNTSIAEWYKDGQDDPELALLRLDPEQAEIWQHGSSFVEGVKALFRADPKKDYESKVAKIRVA
jgi:general stress protein 26